MEKQQEQLEKSILEIDLRIQEEKNKVVNVEVMQQTLTTFDELYAEATPEEKKDLMQCHINRLFFAPTEIRLALFQIPTENIPHKSASVTSKGFFQPVDNLAPFHLEITSHLGT